MKYIHPTYPELVSDVIPKESLFFTLCNCGKKGILMFIKGGAPYTTLVPYYTGKEEDTQLNSWELSYGVERLEHLYQCIDDDGEYDKEKYAKITWEFKSKFPMKMAERRMANAGIYRP